MRNRQAVFYLIFFSLLFLLINIAKADPTQEGTAQIPSPEVTTSISIEARTAATPEVTNPVSSEVQTSASPEAGKPVSVEAQAVATPEAGKPAVPTASHEVTTGASGEALPPPGIIPASASPLPAPPSGPPPEEGSSYKGVPWGCDFNRFKQIKSFTGSLGSPSAGFINSASDNDIALLLNVPVSKAGDKKEQRVRFEFVPQKFAAVYFEPDDVYYVFYDGKFSMVFSNLIAKNFELYRDNFYKKYTNIGLVTKQYTPSSNRKYRIDALRFERGQTIAFLIKSQDTVKDKTSVSAKMVLFSSDLFNSVQKEIKDKVSGENQSKNLKLENDLKKIE